MSGYRDREVRQLAADDPDAAAGESKLARFRRSYRASKADVLRGDAKLGVKDIEFVWRLLSGTDKQAARAAAVVRLNQIGIPLEMLGATDLEDECAWQILSMAMRDPDEAGSEDDIYPRPLCADVDELRDLVSSDERDALINRYLDFEEEHNPAPATMTEGEFAQILHAAKKKPTESLGQLMSFGTRALAICLHTLVAQQPASDSGSSGSSQSSQES